MEVEIPNKSSFKLNEVCSITGVKSYVLRFWESEFPEISPLTSGPGEKIYVQKDIEAILIIKKLLFVEKMSIEKAKLHLQTLMPQAPHSIVNDVELERDGENEDDLYSSDENIEISTIDKGNDRERSAVMLAKNKLLDIVQRANLVNQAHHWI